MQITAYSYLSDFVHWNEFSLYSTFKGGATNTENCISVDSCRYVNLGKLVCVLQHGNNGVFCHRAAQLFFPKVLPLQGQIQTPFFHGFHINNYCLIGSLVQSLSSLPFVITKSGKESRLIAVPALDLWLIQFIAPVSNSQRVFVE